MRPGTQAYARDNGTYGLATLRSRHVTVRGSLLSLSFRGKHGVLQRVELHSRRLAQIVRAMLRMPGPELFKFRNYEGEVLDLQTRRLNAYVKQAMGSRFSARDFRTWVGTLVCAAELKRCGVVPEPDRRAAVGVALRETARVLGNTPAVARESYVHPLVVDAYMRGRVVTVALADPTAWADHVPNGLTRAERALVRLLEG